MEGVSREAKMDNERKIVGGIPNNNKAWNLFCWSTKPKMVPSKRTKTATFGVVGTATVGGVTTRELVKVPSEVQVLIVHAG